MDQLPALPQNLPVFWMTLFVFLNVAVTLCCVYVVPALQKLRDGKLGERKYSDDRADKGYQAVISQQAQEKEALAAVIEEKDSDLKAINEKFTEVVRLSERYKTQYENADAEILRLREDVKEKTIQIAELRKDIQRLQDHEKAQKAQFEQSRKDLDAVIVNMETQKPA